VGHLPSIQTLRAFEAAARLQSYSRAGEELGLTHGAISHRIRELEDHVGGQLFRRAGNRMVPTERGQLLLGKVQYALETLAQAFDAGGAANCRLRISVLPALATAWLISRLPHFRSLYPHIDLELQLSDALTTFERSKLDGGIRFGRGGWPSLHSELLAKEVLFPVCAPDYQRRLGITAPFDLGRATLLRNPWQPWRDWLTSAQVDLGEPVSGPSFSDAAAVLQAAAAGEGVALARGVLAHDYLAAGRLIRLFDIEVGDPYSYHLVWQPHRRNLSPALELFKQWLKAQFTATSL
jgi:LysR family glycine cleavage system transcriptional activator